MNSVKNIFKNRGVWYNIKQTASDIGVKDVKNERIKR